MGILLPVVTAVRVGVGVLSHPWSVAAHVDACGWGLLAPVFVVLNLRAATALLACRNVVGCSES